MYFIELQNILKAMSTKISHSIFSHTHTPDNAKQYEVFQCEMAREGIVEESFSVDCFFHIKRESLSQRYDVQLAEIRQDPRICAR